VLPLYFMHITFLPKCVLGAAVISEKCVVYSLFRFKSFSTILLRFTANYILNIFNSLNIGSNIQRGTKK